VKPGSLRKQGAKSSGDVSPADKMERKALVWKDKRFI
jgi:hypothetical protein